MLLVRNHKAVVAKRLDFIVIIKLAQPLDFIVRGLP